MNITKEPLFKNIRFFKKKDIFRQHIDIFLKEDYNHEVEKSPIKMGDKSYGDKKELIYFLCIPSRLDIMEAAFLTI